MGPATSARRLPCEAAKNASVVVTWLTGKRGHRLQTHDGLGGRQADAAIGRTGGGDQGGRTGRRFVAEQLLGLSQVSQELCRACRGRRGAGRRSRTATPAPRSARRSAAPLRDRVLRTSSGRSNPRSSAASSNMVTTYSSGERGLSGAMATASCAKRAATARGASPEL